MSYFFVVYVKFSQSILIQLPMAGKKRILFRLLSSAGTGYFYVGSKPTTQTLHKLCLRKYDPFVNQYVLFNQVKMPSGKKKT